MKVFLLVVILGLAYYGAFLPWVWHLDDGPVFSDSHRAATHLGTTILAIAMPLVAYLGYKFINKLFDESK